MKTKILSVILANIIIIGFIIFTVFMQFGTNIKVLKKVEVCPVDVSYAEVDFCWSRWCSSEMFDSECRKYDLSPIKNVTVPLKSCSDTKMNMPLWFWNLAGFKMTGSFVKFRNGEYVTAEK